MDLSELVFGLSDLAVRLDKLGDDKDKYGLDLDMKRAKCLTLLTQSLLQNGLKYLEELEATTLDLVSGIHKVTFCGCYLPFSKVGFYLREKVTQSNSRLPRVSPRGRYV